MAAKEAEDLELLEYQESRPQKRRAKGGGETSQAKKRMVASRDQSSDSNSVIDEEPNSPPEDSYVEASLDQESMLAELNRQIEEHKKELSEMQKTIGNDEDEPYSPSHADSPTPEGEQLKLDTSKISIPANLQEILDNIKEKEAEIKQKEQEIKRRLSLTSDPIVMNYGKYQAYEKKKEKIATSPGKDVDLRPLLHTKSNKDSKTDTDLRVLKATTEEKKSEKVESVTKQEEDVDLRIRDPRLARAQAQASAAAAATTTAAPASSTTDNSEKGKTLSKMTDEELLAKALEMEDSSSSSRQAVPEAGAESQFHPVIPVPPPFIPPAMPAGFAPPGGPIVGPDPRTGPMPPPMPPGPPPFMGSVSLPSMDMYGSQGSRIPGPHGPPNFAGHVPPGAGPAPHASGGFSGPPGPQRQNYPGPAWEGGQGYSGRGWGPEYRDRDRDRDWDRDRDRDWDRNRDWDRDRDWDRERKWDWNRERERDWEMRHGRDKGHSRYKYKGKRNEGKGKGRDRNKDKPEKEKEAPPPKESEGSGDDESFHEIDY